MTFYVKNQRFLSAGLLLLLLIAVGYGLSGVSKKTEADFSAIEIKINCSGAIGRSSEYLGSREVCYAKQFQKVASAKGAEFAFNLLSKLQDLDPGAKGCHLIAHGIGWGIYEHNPADWQNQIRSVNQGCTYGAVHGIIEKLVAALPEKKMTDELMLSICGKNPRADCNHIIGHLLVVETRGNVDEALRRCQIFTENRQKDFCYTGVFMEYQTALNLIVHGIAPKEWLNWPKRVGELEKMCRSYDGLKAEACWEEIVHAALVKFDNKAERIFAFCSTAPLTNAVKRCRKHSIGIMAAGVNFNLASIKDICQLPQKDDSDFETECYRQLAASAISSLPQDRQRVEKFCLGLLKKFQDSCLFVLTLTDANGKIPVQN